MMLLREEHAVQGQRERYLAMSPLARAEISLLLAHQSGRKDDPLIQAFTEAARVAWPGMRLSQPAYDGPHEQD
jgi:hypothetical protein